MALRAVPALAQGPITIVSPHPGEHIGADDGSTYWVRWRSPAIPGNAGFVVSYATSGGPVTICEAAPAARECEWVGAASLIPFTSTLSVEARDVNGVALASSDSGSFSIVSDGIAFPWENHRDIGDVGRSGNLRVTENGRFVLRGAGAGIQGTADAFHGLNSFAGTAGEDFNGRATLTHIDGAHPWAQLGMMLRADFLEAGEIHHSVLATPDHGIVYQRRLSPSGPTLTTTLSRSSDLPVTFEVMRRSGYTVLNVMRQGVWREVASLPSVPAHHVALVVTSHDRRRFATGTFRNVSLNTNGFWTVRIMTPEFGTELFQDVPFTIEWEQQSPLPATVSYSINRGLTWTVVPGCASVTTSMCLWTNPGPATTEARIRVVVNDPADREAWAATFPFVIR
jgi:predicted Rdx family selenoprotein